MTAASQRDYSELIKRVDECADITGAGIMLSLSSGKDVEVRGGPRRVWVFLIQRNTQLTAPVPAEESGFRQFWDRWGDVVTNCGGAAATGAVIYMSGGTATPLVGAFALNSAALCGLSAGKQVSRDEWANFEAAGGVEFKTYFTIETLMSAADLLNGMAGVVKLMKEWQSVGKLARLKALLEKSKPTSTKALAKVLKDIDPALEMGAKQGRRARLISTGHDVIDRSKFKSITHQRLKLIIDTVGQTLTGIGGVGVPENLRQLPAAAAALPSGAKAVATAIEYAWDMTITQVDEPKASTGDRAIDAAEPYVVTGAY